MAVNTSEEVVEQVCRRSFLSMWSIPNPQGKDAGKELCDILIVCNPYIIVISVKDIALKRTEDPKHGFDRWLRKAVDASAQQIAGACRWLETASCVTLSDGSRGPDLPPRDQRRILRIAVAFGSEGEVLYSSTDMYGGFVHVFTEHTFESIFAELDTITDFTDYLVAKETLLDRCPVVIIQGTERDLMALYLFANRQFSDSIDLLVVEDDLWAGFESDPGVLRKREADKVSYAWDRLVERLSAELIEDRSSMTSYPSEAEFVLRHMAQESRFSRRGLGERLLDFSSAESRARVRARVVESYTEGLAYVFLNAKDTEDRQEIARELQSRCYIVRGLYPGAKVVLGISFERREPDGAYRTMLCRIEPPEWTEQDTLNAKEGVEITGWFKNAEWYRLRMDEYPSAD